MPFAGLHSFRIKSPDQFDDFRMKKDEFGNGIHVVYGLKAAGGETKSEVQAIRFETSTFTKEQALEWLKTNNFAPISYEAPADMANVVLPCPDASDFERLDLEPRPDGKKANRYRKELIHEGLWVHPQTGVEIKLKRGHLDRFVEKFSEMIAAGLKIPVIQDHAMNAESGIGWLVDLAVKQVEKGGRKLWGLFGELEIGDDWSKRIDEGKIRDVSISVQDVQDGHENLWRSVIDEVSVTLFPVIESQTGFVKLSKTEGGYEYVGPPKRGKLGRSRRMLNGKRKKDGEGQDFSALTARLDRLEEENKGLKSDLAKKDEELGKVQLARVEQVKEDIVADIDARVEKGLTPDSVKKLSTIVDRVFDNSPTEEEAKAWQSDLSAFLDTVVVAGVKMGREIEDDGNGGGETSLRDKPLDEAE